MIGLTLAKYGLAVTLPLVAILAQVPPADFGGDLTKYGVLGALVMVIIALLFYTIPSILKTSEINTERLAQETKAGFDDVASEIKSGNDKVATLLQSTLTQLFNERRNS